MLEVQLLIKGFLDIFLDWLYPEICEHIWGTKMAKMQRNWKTTGNEKVSKITKGMVKKKHGKFHIGSWPQVMEFFFWN